jgi:hypothetical protein
VEVWPKEAVLSTEGTLPQELVISSYFPLSGDTEQNGSRAGWRCFPVENGLRFANPKGIVIKSLQ